jgi:hypothetical protein
MYGTTCDSGVCACDGAPFNDNSNCGQCGRTCAPTSTCNAGDCECPDTTIWGTTSSCSACGDVCQDVSVCVPTNASLVAYNCLCPVSNNPVGSDTDCAACNDACTDAGTSCQSNQCLCPNAKAFNDPTNCGACGSSCVGDADGCSSGVCTCSGNGLPFNDDSNCGGCGLSCTAGQSCYTFSFPPSFDATAQCLCPGGLPLGTDDNCNTCGKEQQTETY